MTLFEERTLKERPVKSGRGDKWRYQESVPARGLASTNALSGNNGGQCGWRAVSQGRMSS